MPQRCLRGALEVPQRTNMLARLPCLQNAPLRFAAVTNHGRQTGMRAVVVQDSVMLVRGSPGSQGPQEVPINTIC